MKDRVAATSLLEKRYGERLRTFVAKDDEDDVWQARLRLCAASDWAMRILALREIHHQDQLELAAQIVRIAARHTFSFKGANVVQAAHIVSRLGVVGPLIGKLEGMPDGK